MTETQKNMLERHLHPSLLLSILSRGKREGLIERGGLHNLTAKGGGGAYQRGGLNIEGGTGLNRAFTVNAHQERQPEIDHSQRLNWNSHSYSFLRLFPC